MPQRIVRYARTHLGRRGTLLALLGISWIVIGIMVPFRVEPDHLVLLNIFEEARTAAWIVTGAVALWAARRREDRLGWSALYIMGAYRAVGYAAGAVGIATTHGGAGTASPDFADSISRAATWTAILAVIRICSGWREHPEEMPVTGGMPTVPARENTEEAE